MTDAQFNDPGQVDTDLADDDFPEDQLSSPDDRIDDLEDDDVDYEDENSVRGVE